MAIGNKLRLITHQSIAPERWADEERLTILYFSKDIIETLHTGAPEQKLRSSTPVFSGEHDTLVQGSGCCYCTVPALLSFHLSDIQNCTAGSIDQVHLDQNNKSPMPLSLQTTN